MINFEILAAIVTLPPVTPIPVAKTTEDTRTKSEAKSASEVEVRSNPRRPKERSKRTNQKTNPRRNLLPRNPKKMKTRK